jgi:signal transduction histidine kinase/PAS domain-containing protein/ActR/RegA family two-component response regulator
MCVAAPVEGRYSRPLDGCPSGRRGALRENAATAERVFFGRSEMARLCRGFDWSQTPLGPLEGWPSALRHAVGNLLAQPFACSIIWGPEQTLIYNDAFLPVAGERHPWALGKPVGDVFPEATAARSAIVERVSRGESVYTEDALFQIVRRGAVTDAWFTLSCVPLRGDDGRVAGALTTAIETTARLLAESEKQRRDEHAAFLADASDALLTAATESAALAVLAAKAGQFLRVAACLCLELDETRELVEVRHAWLAPGGSALAPRRLDAAAAATVLATLRDGRALVCHGGVSDVRACAEVARALGVAAFMAAPLVRDGRCRFALCVAEPAPRRFELDEVELLRELAERLWLRIERARAERRIIETADSYRTLFETMSEAFCVLEVVRDQAANVIDARVQEVNRRAEAVMGLPREQIVGRLRSELGPSRLLEVYAGVAQTGEPARVEVPSPDGRWYDVRLYPRGPERIAVLYDDITERKRTEAALRASEERQAFLLELSDALRPLVDPIAIQFEACRLLGEKVLSDRAYYAEIDDAGAQVSIAREYRRGGAPSVVGTYPVSAYDWSYEAFRQNNPLVIEDAQASALIPEAQRAPMEALRVRSLIAAPLYKSGRLLGCFTATDLAVRRWTAEEIDLVREVAERTWAAVERARAEAALAAELSVTATARAQAEAANQAKDAFLATLSHELRTPLAAILLWAGALRSGAVPLQDLSRAIDAIVKSAESQSRLIEDLLDLSRLASGKLALGCSVVDVRAAAQAALDMVKPQASGKNLVLTAELGDECVAVLDGTRLEQVLWNLLSNATKFTPSGGAVGLRLRADEARGIELEVSDTGEGIAPEFLPHLFEKFSQYDMGETRQHMGLGIGLALARQLVELHGGSIEAESAGLGRGALFRVRLPWRRPAPVVCAATAPVAAAAALDAAPLRRLRVLLVDDDAITRQAMCWTLTRAGASVVDVGTAEEALVALGSGEGADVIVSDLGLPVVSGLALIRRVVQDARREGRRTPPACAVSAHARDVDRRRAIEAGFDMYITKPVSAERLVEAVSDLGEIFASGRD